MSDTIVDPRENKLLGALHAFPGGNIYLVAPKAAVAEGFALYRQHAVTSFAWSEDRSSLAARVRSSTVNVVVFFLNQDSLAFSCGCRGWNERHNCGHVVSALMTFKNLFQPALFRQDEEDAERREFLLSGVTGRESAEPKQTEKKKPEGYAVVLEKKDRGAEVYISNAGARTGVYYSLLTRPLRGLLFHPHTPSHILVEGLIRYLDEHANRYPVIVKADGVETEVHYDDSLDYATGTGLDVRGDRVWISKECTAGGADERLVIIDRFAFHPETKRLGIIRDTEGWSQWNAFHRLLSGGGAERYAAALDGNSFTIPLGDFRRYQIAYNRDRRDAVLEQHVLKKDGDRAPLRQATHAYRLAATSIEEGRYFSLRADCLLGKDPVATSFSAFSFFDSLRARLPQYLLAKKRQKALCGAFFSLTAAETKTETEKIIKAAFAAGDIDKHAMKREAREFLTCYRAKFIANEEQLHYHDDAWTIVGADKQKELLLYRIPYELFGWEAIDGMRSYREMIVDGDRFSEALPVLAARLDEQGIALVLNEKPVRSAQWDVLIDATSKPDIDWFEIKPEIRCNGRLLDESVLAGLFAERRVVEQDGEIRILDDATRKVLQKIAAMSQASQGRARREREIVRVPRLQILDWLALRNSGVTVNLPAEDEEILQRLLNFERIGKKPLPLKLATRLRSYQQDGYHWLAFLYEHRFGGCLADDMGLGKTVQAISLLGGIKEGTVRPPAREASGPHLIVVPPSLLFNWEHEIGKFYPDLKVHLYAGNERKADFSGQDVVLTTYGTARRDIEILEKVAFNVMIFDEAQAVKNIYAETTGAVRRLRGTFKLSMTGTPLENHLGEYYSIIDLAMPGLLGEYDAFRPLIKSGASPALDVVIQRTRPFVLRRTKGSVLKDLPPKTETDIYLELTDHQKALYQTTVEQVRTTIDEAYRTKTGAQAKIIALTAILKLRQICISPQLVSRDFTGLSPKMDFLIDQLRELMEENHSALVFSQFTSFLDILGHALDAKEIAFSRLDGSTPTAKRKTLVREFQSGEGPSVFLLSLKAGGQGLNLTKASYVFHLDPWWNPAVEDQASDRAHRIGQQNKVTVTRLLMRHTIEEKMMELKKRKRTLYEAIMNEGSANARGLEITKSDFNFLLG